MSDLSSYVPYWIALAAAIGGLAFIASGPSTPKTRPVLNAKEFQSFELVEKKVLSHNTAIYRFKLPNETDVLGLPIGQHISLSATIDGKNVLRSYTPISADEDVSCRGHFELLIKSYPTGNISRHVGNLKVGESMLVRGPKGEMTYTPNMVRRFGMIAGGTGITPMLQIIRAILRGREKGDRTRVDLIFANVNEDDVLLREDLDRLAAEDEGFNVYYVLNNPPAGWTGGVGFVSREMIEEHLPPPASDIKILICGPLPMVKAMTNHTNELGYEKAARISKLEHQVFAF